MIKPWPASILPFKDHACATLRHLKGIYPTCSCQQHMLEQFDHECTQLVLGPKSYVALWNKDVAWEGIPAKLQGELDRSKEKQPVHVALGCDSESDYYYVKFNY